VGEASKSCTIEVDRQRLIRKTEGIDTHIELATPKKQRAQEISLADIGLGGVVTIEALPTRNFTDTVEDEYPLALALAGLSSKRGTGFMIQRERVSFWVLLNSS
jgi:hypothetical protein